MNATERVHGDAPNVRAVNGIIDTKGGDAK